MSKLMNDVTQVVDRLDREIAKLTGLKTGLLQVFGTVPTPALEGVARAVQRNPGPEVVLFGDLERPVAGSLRPANKATARTGKKHGKKALQKGLMDKLRAIAGLAEPWSQGDVARACQCVHGTASGTIDRGMKRGWWRRVGRDQYERTGKFPALEEKTTEARRGPSLPAAGNGSEAHPEQEELRRKWDLELKKAQQDYATADRNGRATLAAILKDKVAKLQEELNALNA